MNKQTPVLRGRNLTIGYQQNKRNKIIQSSLNFSLEEGEIVCLIGPNGSGKSTLLKTLTGFIPAISGEILLQNENILDISIQERSRKIAIVLTQKIDVDNLSVKELVELGRNPYTNIFGSLTENDNYSVQQAIENVRLTQKSQEQLCRLSDGERQRAMIAKALCQQTPIILLDEPTAHLDLPNRIEILILLRELAHTLKKTILLSTHELDLALQISDRIMIMDVDQGLKIGIPEGLIITHVIQSIFNHHKFSFDNYTGVFRLNHPSNKEVTLSCKGEGFLMYWTERALNRIGIKIVDEADIRISIDERHRFWTYESPQYATQFDQIETLIQHLCTPNQLE